MAKVYVSNAVKGVRQMYGDHLKQVTRDRQIADWLRELIELLWAGYQASNPAVVEEISNHHPDMIGASKDEIFSKGLQQKDMELVILEEYGFASLSDASTAGAFDSEFERTVNLVLQGQAEAVANILSKNPLLVNQASQFGHKSNLIQYLGVNGTEIWRQYLPINTLDMMELLLQQGADPEQKNDIYGGSDLKSLIETSEHTFQAGLADQMIEKLEIYGY